VRILCGETGPAPFFTRSASRAAKVAAARRGAVGVWASRAPARIGELARDAGAPVAWIEDGFIRSQGLGVECRPPASITLDWRAPHYDPTRPSDLEICLSERTFPSELVARAGALIRAIVEHGVTKYNLSGDAFRRPDDGRRHVLVAGQVEDDASFKLGGGGLKSNLQLLRRARELEPGAVIYFRPHPDVESGHRRGRIRDSEALAYADRVLRGQSLAALLASVDAVHAATSLSGFEGLLRGREVIVHGQPFYAGWGLTRDLAPIARRRRRLAVAELAAGALILYARYLDPSSGALCGPEQLVARLAGGEVADAGALPHVRRLQGRALRWLGTTQLRSGGSLHA
jgi:capsular polysaccharide export protein